MYILGEYYSDLALNKICFWHFITMSQSTKRKWNSGPSTPSSTSRLRKQQSVSYSWTKSLEKLDKNWYKTSRRLTEIGDRLETNMPTEESKKKFCWGEIVLLNHKVIHFLLNKRLSGSWSYGSSYLLTLPLCAGVSRIRALSPAWTGSHSRETLISRTISPQQKYQVQ
jgi:hypothetical protein